MKKAILKEISSLGLYMAFCKLYWTYRVVIGTSDEAIRQKMGIIKNFSSGLSSYKMLVAGLGRITILTSDGKKIAQHGLVIIYLNGTESNSVPFLN